MTLWSEIMEWGECEREIALTGGHDPDAAYQSFMLGARCFAREALMQYERHEWDERRLLDELRSVADLDEGDACAR